MRYVCKDIVHFFSIGGEAIDVKNVGKNCINEYVYEFLTSENMEYAACFNKKSLPVIIEIDPKREWGSCFEIDYFECISENNFSSDRLKVI